VDKAVQEARRHIALGPAGFKSRDFATPVLFMRGSGRPPVSTARGKITGVQADKTLIRKLQEKLYDKCDDLDERTYLDVSKRLKTMKEKRHR